MTDLSSYIDHTLLLPTARETDIRKWCEKAWIHQFKAVCIAPSYVAYTAEMLEFCPVKIEISTVIGFPMGYSTSETKMVEAITALRNGATELDVVMNISQFKSMAYVTVRDELQQIATIAHEANAIIKVIIETAYLDAFELHTACEIATEAGVDYVNTSTGFAPEGADLETVRKMRTLLSPQIRIKATGGIKSYEQAILFIEAGADRIGTSSGLSIVKQE